MATIASRILALENGRKGRITVITILDGSTAALDAYKLSHRGKEPDRILTITIVDGIMDPLPLPDRSVRRG